ncbi:unnamed protein product [Merluccius merluccius]
MVPLALRWEEEEMMSAAGVETRGVCLPAPRGASRRADGAQFESPSRLRCSTAPGDTETASEKRARAAAAAAARGRSLLCNRNHLT